jgi:hypothetical protein
MLSRYTATKYRGDQAVIKAVQQIHDSEGDEEVPTQHQPESLSLTVLYLGCVTGAGDTFSVGRPAAVYRDFMQVRYRCSNARMTVVRVMCTASPSYGASMR